MRSPVSRIAAAVIFILAVGGVVWWFHGGGAAPVYADFFKPILEAKTVKYRMVTKTVGTGEAGVAGGKTTTVIMMRGPSRTRVETESESPDVRDVPRSKTRSIEIRDEDQGKRLCLDPEKKLATLYDYIDRPKDKTPEDADLLRGWRSVFLEAQKAAPNSPGVKREPLGKKEIDGRQVSGFRMTTPIEVIEVWGDPKTGMPVRIDEEHKGFFPGTNAKMTASDFELNLDLDESLFSVKPPAGYKVTVVRQTHETPPGEYDLVQAFQWYVISNNGKYPDSLDQMLAWFGAEMSRECIRDMCTPPSGKMDEKKKRKVDEFLRRYMGLYAEYDSKKKLSKEEEKKLTDKLHEEFYSLVDWDKVAPGRKNLSKEEKTTCEQEYSERFMRESPKASLFQGMSDSYRFVFERGLSPQSDAHYAGKGVLANATDRPIFWYRPKDAKTYRVIYADFSVRIADTPPNVPNAQPVPGTAKAKN